MRTQKRSICLNEIKTTFHQSGYVDWHLTPRLSVDDAGHEDDGDIVFDLSNQDEFDADFVEEINF